MTSLTPSWQSSTRRGNIIRTINARPAPTTTCCMRRRACTRSSGPIGALVVVVGAEESVQALRRMQHVVVGAGRALIVLIIFPRRVELCQLGVKLVIRHR